MKEQRFIALLTFLSEGLKTCELVTKVKGLINSLMLHLTSLSSFRLLFLESHPIYLKVI